MKSLVVLQKLGDIVARANAVLIGAFWTFILLNDATQAEQHPQAWTVAWVSTVFAGCMLLLGESYLVFSRHPLPLFLLCLLECTLGLIFIFSFEPESAMYQYLIGVTLLAFAGAFGIISIGLFWQTKCPAHAPLNTSSSSTYYTEVKDTLDV